MKAQHLKLMKSSSWSHDTVILPVMYTTGMSVCVTARLNHFGLSAHEARLTSLLVVIEMAGGPK